MNIDLINSLKYRLLEKYRGLEDQSKVNELIDILENLEKKINILEKEINK